MRRLSQSLAAIGLLASLAATSFADNWTGGSIDLDWELSPPSTAAKGEEFDATAACNYNANMAANKEWEYGSPSITFEWAYPPDGGAVGGGSDTGAGGSGGGFSYKSQRTVVYNTASAEADDKTVKVRAHVTGTIVDYGPDEEKGTEDDVTYTIDDWSDWLEADLTVYTVTLGVRRTGSGGAYGTSATVAAGGVDSDVHKADIEVATSPAVASVTLDIVVGKKAGEGEGQPDTGGTASVSMNSYTTDANGKAYGTFASSNKIESVTLECQDSDGTPLAGFGTATITQAWDDDAGLEFNVPEYFIPEIADTCKFTCRLDEGVPIDGHTINWYTTKITLNWYSWNIDTDDEDWGESDYNDPFTGDDALPFGKAIGDFVVYSGGSEDPSGVYAKAHTVHDYFDIVEVAGEYVWQEALVMKYDFGVYDTGVYTSN